jgi:hypothetical protein
VTLGAVSAIIGLITPVLVCDPQEASLKWPSEKN